MDRAIGREARLSWKYLVNHISQIPDYDKASPFPSTLPESPGQTSPSTALLLGLVDCRKTPGQSGTKRGGGEDKEDGDLFSLRDIPNRCTLSGRGLSSGEPQQRHDADKKEKSLSRSEHLKKHQHRGRLSPVYDNISGMAMAPTAAQMSRVMFTVHLS
ncbi:uncharacterized protein isoform X5 [Salmo salar]|uniref:Uncharacterized protein isoform X5 n=1 Tax=Salmo salar TaxID=8030 RepID=A0ABM3E0V1_SALSA|nr:uncharacterized protein LOC106596266 isoform X5 [Salmo salar]